ncbi:MAG: MBL fold metallo-hydrolase, partial [Anaerolineales bacterium]|nr:MBL fold metallo-hydrolase [Anaerolineales bacterium]
QPGVMIWGGAATLAGMAWTTLGQPLAWIAWLFLAVTIGLVRAFAAVPGAAIALSVPPSGILVLYAFIGVVTWFAKVDPERRTAVSSFLRRNVSQRLALGGSFVVLLLVGNWGVSQPDGRLHVTFFDVGQGDAIFIQTPGGRQILVDGGYYPSTLNDQLGRRMPFWDRQVDLLVATHPDADHVAGLAGVFDRYAVARLLTDGEGLGESAIYDAVLLAAEAQNTEVLTAQAGEVIIIDDGVRLEVLNPDRKLETGERNNNSVVLRLVYGDFSLLLTGDAETDAEKRMLDSGLPLTAVVLKAGHHGSKSSSSAAFLSAVRPEFVIFSAGVDNRFGHPSPEVLERAQAVGAAVLRTDELGSVEVTTDGHVMWWRAGPK